MKVFLRILMVISIIFVLFVAGMILFLTNDLKKNIDLTINDVDLSKIKDGTYKGNYGSGRWNNKLEVIIKDNKIVDINIIKTVLFEKRETTDELLKRVVDEQKVNVDAISGATATSKCYLKSIENALK